MNPSGTSISLYFIPGLAANTRIFEYLNLPDGWNLHYLDWMPPESKSETLDHYARRMAERVNDPQGILVGVSFGGVVVQEMEKYLDPKRIIIISSIKSKFEMPARMRFAGYTGAHRILPTGLISHIEKYEKYAFGNLLKKRVKLYKKYLGIRDDNYLQWAIHRIVTWDREHPGDGIVHIHGTADAVFPAKNIRNFIPVENGTHIMILNKARTISKILTQVIDS